MMAVICATPVSPAVQLRLPPNAVWAQDAAWDACASARIRRVSTAMAARARLVVGTVTPSGRAPTGCAGRQPIRKAGPKAWICQ